MPRVKPLIRVDPREREVLQTIGGMAAATGRSYRQICGKAGIDYCTFMRHKKDLQSMRLGELWKFLDTCRRELGDEREKPGGMPDLRVCRGTDQRDAMRLASGN